MFVFEPQVWDSCSDSLIAFDNEDLLDNLAYIAENNVVEEALRRRLEAVADRVDVRYQTSAKSYIIPGVTSGHGELHQNSWVTVKLQDNRALKTKLLVSVYPWLISYSVAVFSYSLVLCIAR